MMTKLFTILYIAAHIAKWPSVLIAAFIGTTGGLLYGFFTAMVVWLFFKITTLALFICAGASLASEVGESGE